MLDEKQEAARFVMPVLARGSAAEKRATQHSTIGCGCETVGMLPPEAIDCGPLEREIIRKALCETEPAPEQSRDGRTKWYSVASDYDSDSGSEDIEVLLQGPRALAMLPNVEAWEYPLTRGEKQGRLLRLSMMEQASTQHLLRQSQDLLFRRIEDSVVAIKGQCVLKAKCSMQSSWELW